MENEIKNAISKITNLEFLHICTTDINDDFEKQSSGGEIIISLCEYSDYWKAIWSWSYNNLDYFRIIPKIMVKYIQYGVKTWSPLKIILPCRLIVRITHG
jgi:hypothetical protein